MYVFEEFKGVYYMLKIIEGEDYWIFSDGKDVHSKYKTDKWSLVGARNHFANNLNFLYQAKTFNTVDSKKEERNRNIMEEIIAICADYYLVDKELVKSKKRDRDIVRIKSYATKVIKDLYPETTLKSLGRAMDVDHSTIIHRLNMISQEMEIYEDTRNEYNAFKRFVEIKIGRTND